ncbi:unnamed protein product [Vitrella brassicaformis CCMP3155]|uniref:Uncharacterized protein n=2 Tax=Vitrella brassicaformis TaxID=1169539 RepID=A0A0G4F3V0_VITBC|nr:unnamed protein product [Vitrella brassicaformis CCMP3155]|eukprot:CEM06678.1 unnamed protein product [Vitrella brassicaformis CCMP3155]
METGTQASTLNNTTTITVPGSDKLLEGLGAHELHACFMHVSVQGCLALRTSCRELYRILSSDALFFRHRVSAHPKRRFAPFGAFSRSRTWERAAWVLEQEWDWCRWALFFQFLRLWYDTRVSISDDDFDMAGLQYKTLLTLPETIAQYRFFGHQVQTRSSVQSIEPLKDDNEGGRLKFVSPALRKGNNAAWVEAADIGQRDPAVHICSTDPEKVRLLDRFNHFSTFVPCLMLQAAVAEIKNYQVVAFLTTDLPPVQDVLQNRMGLVFVGRAVARQGHVALMWLTSHDSEQLVWVGKTNEGSFVRLCMRGQRHHDAIRALRDFVRRLKSSPRITFSFTKAMEIFDPAEGTNKPRFVTADELLEVGPREESEPIPIPPSQPPAGGIGAVGGDGGNDEADDDDGLDVQDDDQPMPHQDGGGAASTFDAVSQPQSQAAGPPAAAAASPPAASGASRASAASASMDVVDEDGDAIMALTDVQANSGSKQ